MPNAKWTASIDKAFDMIGALCAPKYTEGSRTWTMSIPAQPDYDPDLIIAAGLQAGRDAMASHTDLIAALEEIERHSTDGIARLKARAALAKARGE